MKGTRFVALAMALALCAAFLPAQPLAARPPTPEAVAGLRSGPVGFAPVTRYRMVFPLAGPIEVLSVFGAERDGGERDHKGVDLGASQLTPVLAVKDGVITHLNPLGVSVFIRHDDGWSSWYLHLNNDTYLTDDGRGAGLVPGLVEGDRVVAGQVIGWVGDSGNAETTPHHLHFELRTPWGEPIDPLRSLRAAAWVDEAVPVSFQGAFWDDDDHEIAPTADLLASLGLIRGCGPYGLELCPDEVLTGADVETLLGAALGVEIPVADYLELDEPPDRVSFHVDVEIQQSLGCGIWLYCPEQVLTRGDMAAILAGAMAFEPTDADYFFDDEIHYAESAANALVAAEVLDSCTAQGPELFEPDRPATRAELIDAIAKALGLVEVDSCRITT